MKARHLPSMPQTGYMLMEALMAMLVLSIGILSLVRLQAASIKNANDAQYRTEASLLANDLIGRMWAADRTPATLQANFSSPIGAAYIAWAGAPGDAYGSGTVSGTLPGVAGVAANQPIVGVVPIAGVNPPSTSKTQVTITLFWQAPGATAPSQYTVVTEIK